MNESMFTSHVIHNPKKSQQKLFRTYNTHYNDMMDLNDGFKSEIKWKRSKRIHFENSIFTIYIAVRHRLFCFNLNPLFNLKILVPFFKHRHFFFYMHSLTLLCPVYSIRMSLTHLYRAFIC